MNGVRFGLFEFDDWGAGEDLLSDGDHNFFDDTGPVGAELLVHLHRFENADQVAGYDLIAGVHFYREDSAREGRPEQPGGPGALSTMAPAGLETGDGAGDAGRATGADGPAASPREGESGCGAGYPTSTWMAWPSTTAVIGRRVRSPTSTVYHFPSTFTLTVSGMMLPS